jgi:hypothetical protein
MAVNRRSFFKVLGVTGVSLAIGKKSGASPKSSDTIEFSGILYDSTRCAAQLQI